MEVITFNQEVSLKPYINMNTKLKNNTENNFGKGFWKLMNNAVFGKTMKNIRKLKDVTTKAGTNYLASELN